MHATQARYRDAGSLIPRLTHTCVVRCTLLAMTKYLCKSKDSARYRDLRGGRHRYYATVYRARSSQLLLGHRLASRAGRRARRKRSLWCLRKRYGPFGRQ
eukprot:scaffold75980_cov56-Phaeocystis_antarctica.AAC.3